MIYFLPLEGYKERYTAQQSGPGGWFESYWTKNSIPFKRISLHDDVSTIKQGAIVDYSVRAEQSFFQITELLRLISSGSTTNRDCIYFDDFWTPGMEQIAYALSFVTQDRRPKLFAFCYAQSVDEYDFTAQKMLPWIRNFEKGIAGILDGIFVASSLLKEMLVDIVEDTDKIYKVGLPFNSSSVRQMMPTDTVRTNSVVFSSRWDKEKQPNFFLEVAKRVFKERPDITFHICTSSLSLRTNEPDLLLALDMAMEKSNIKVHTGLSKEDYYRILCQSKIQMNTALQDWVSYTLLEASVAGTYPVYPNFRSFPEVFGPDSPHLYEVWNADHAAWLIIETMGRKDLWSHDSIDSRRWIHSYYDSSIKRITNIMLRESR